MNSQCPSGEICRKWTDISFKGNNTWFIDYGENGYYTTAYPPPASRWEYAYTGYGYSDAVPAPADYDGDGLTDLSVKDYGGTWYIDYSSNGFAGWDVVTGPNYGDASAIPVPGDYDKDGRADIAIKDSTGFWGIDYAYDGFGAWNYSPTWTYGWNYGDANSIPVPADYDGDGATDISVKNQSNGYWYIDYSSDGPGRWRYFTTLQYNVSVGGYGTATPVPADYNNDGKADIAEKDSSGTWMIDLAPTFGSWDQPFRYGYGGTSTAVPADYDHDGLLDLSVVDPASGDWYVDYASNGWNGWDYWPGVGQWNMRNQLRDAVDQSQPRVISTKIYDEWNLETTTLYVGKRYTVDVVLEPGVNTASCTTPGLGCTLNSRISTGLAGVCEVVNGVNRCVETASVEANLALIAQPSLTIHDGSQFRAIETWPCSTNANDTFGKCGNTPFCDSTTHVCKPHRRFGIECSQPGKYVLGYQLRNDVAWKGTASHPFNPDYGIGIVCATLHTGLYGWVTERQPAGSTNGQPGFYRPGTAIQSAQITVRETGTTTYSDVNGYWHLDISGGPYTVDITEANHSSTVALHVNVPTGGFELDTPLEEAFTALRAAGATYTTYIDYSRDRLILHTLAISSGSYASARLEQPVETPPAPCPAAFTGPGPNPVACTDASWSNYYPNQQTPATCPGYQTVATAANTSDTLAAMNGVWWDLCTGKALGYMYNGTQMPSFPYCDGGTPRPPDWSLQQCSGSQVYIAEDGLPLFRDANNQAIPGKLTQLNVMGQTLQQFGMAITDENFLATGSDFYASSPDNVIWDPDHDHVSNASYAFQIGNPPLVWEGRAIAAGDFHQTVPNGNYDFVFARTAVGVKTVGLDTVLYLVVADAEGIQGGHGATSRQLAVFFRDVLGVQAATALDSGLSTELVLRGTSWPVPRRVNTLAGEDITIPVVPGLEYLTESDGIFGAVANIIRVVDTTPVIGP